MPRVKRQKFMQDSQTRASGGGNRFSSWKDKGEAVGFVHPKIGIWDRWVHGVIPSIEEEKKGEMKVRKRRPNCIGTSMEEVPNRACPMCLLQEFAQVKKGEGADGAEAILIGGSGKDRVMIDLNDLAGEGGWMNDPKAKQEVTFVWIDPDKVDKATSMKEAIELISGPQTLGERIFEVIDEQVKRRGEIKGDIEVPADFKLKMKKGKMFLVSDEGEEQQWTPYPFQLKFNKDAKPERKYGATKMDADLCELTPDVAQVMLTEEDELDVDFEKLNASTDADKQLAMIHSSWDCRSIPFEEFKDFYESKSGSKGKASAKKAEPKKATAKKADPKKSTAKKADAKKETKPAEEEKPDAEAGDFKFCSECGFKNPRDGKFCQGCGGKLASQKPSPVEDAPKVEDDAGEAGEGKGDVRDAVDDGTVRCQDCGEVVTPLKPSNRCPECGEKISDVSF